MKVVAFNGSPRKNGNTFHLIKIVCEELNKEGVKTELIQLGGADMKGCRACYKCFEKQNMRCIQNDDIPVYRKYDRGGGDYYRLSDVFRQCLL